MEMTGLARSTIYKYISDGQFPKQIKLGARAAGWSREEVEQWLSAKLACR